MAGERGPKGDIGYTGPRGERGGEGRRGVSGATAFSRHVRGSFVAVVAVAFLVTTLLGWQITKTNSLARHNSELIQSVHKLQVQQAEFRVIRAKQTTVTDFTLCTQIEKLKLVQRSDTRRALRRAIAYLAAHPHGAPGIPRPLIVESIDSQRRLLRDLKPVNCSDLPTQKKTGIPNQPKP